MSIQTNQLQRRTWIGAAERDGLAKVLDVLLPGTERQPSGRSVGAHEDLLDRVVDADQRLEAPLKELGLHASAVECCTLHDIENWAGERTEEVVFGLTAAYYMSAEAREAIGYPGQRRLPIGQATPDQVVDDELLAPVRERGSIYVPTPS